MVEVAGWAAKDSKAARNRQENPHGASVAVERLFGRYDSRLHQFDARRAAGVQLIALFAASEFLQLFDQEVGLELLHLEVDGFPGRIARLNDQGIQLL
jgi:hypothetical protein